MALVNANLQQKVAELAARNEALVKMCNSSRHKNKTATGLISANIKGDTK
jgi:hypothetical protein